MSVIEPPRQPLIRLAPVGGRVWTEADRESADRILDWARTGYAVIADQVSGEPPENVYARRAGVDALSAAYRELGRLLDRIAEIEMGIEDAPLPEPTP